MIDRVRVTAFKSIKDLEIGCSKLNLFVGTNSSGKSSFLQALLVAAQNDLNGEYISLGEFREVRNNSMPNSDIRIECWEAESQCSAWIAFKENSEKDSYIVNNHFGNIWDKDVRDRVVIDPTIKLFLQISGPCHYLSCHRIGASDLYSKNITKEHGFGINGEYAMAYLLEHESNPVDRKLTIVDDAITNSLLDQVNFWLNYIVGTTMKVNDLKKTNYLQVRYNNNPANAMLDALYSRPINVGAGISYLISMIIMCLGAKEGATLIIENPEIHLHPKAQSRLCEFLYFVSNADRQVFVETHSDHIFNGLRAGVATKQFDQKNLTVNFFALNNQYETVCNPIVFQEYGKLVGLNENMDLNDLFDQFEIDLERMLGI